MKRREGHSYVATPTKRSRAKEERDFVEVYSLHTQDSFFRDEGTQEEKKVEMNKKHKGQEEHCADEEKSQKVECPSRYETWEKENMRTETTLKESALPLAVKMRLTISKSQKLGNSFYKHLVPQENLEAKTVEEISGSSKEDSQSATIEYESEPPKIDQPVEPMFDPNDPKLEEVAERLLSGWGNSAEKPGCMHLSAKEANITEGIPLVLPKKVFKDDVRFVFAVGLEGIGHHFIGPMFKSSRNSECPPLPVDDDGKASTLAHDNMKKGLFGSNATRDEQKDRLIKYMEMALGVANKRTAHGRRSVMINTMCGMKVGMLSYPNDFMTNKCHKTDFVDVRVLAEMFEAINLDFRVIFMYRNALDVLLSTSVRRGMGRWGELEGIYEHITEKYIIKEQMNRLDPAFYKCFDYDKLPKLPQGFGEFFNLNPEKGGEFKVTTYRVTVNEMSRKRLQQTYSQRDRKKLYKNLQKSIDKVEKICKDTGTQY
eukprot:augustus_masked-scaffold_31-processed-gene-0.41-mRNA-1 protein AED:1.00 eAED:1.00 QI:0/0/0/0/1/1/2/0/484